MIVDIEPISLGISLAAILAFIAPIYISKKKQSNIQKSYQKKFTDEAEKHGLLLETKDYWRGGYGIGIDYGKQKLLYMDPNAQTEFQLIPTDYISHIDLQKQSRSVGTGSKKVEVIDKLSLIISQSSASGTKSSFCFFDGEKYSDLSGEWPLIQKWNSILLEEMAKKKVNK